MPSAAPGCTANVFSCGSDADCGSDGVCEATSYCSFPDSSCNSDRRYSTLAGDGLAGTCVQGPVSVGSASSSAESSGSPPPPPPSPGTTTLDGGVFTGTDPVDASDDTNTADTSSSSGIPPTTGTAVERVFEGLLVLYEFDEGAGTSVMDVSGEGTPLHLEIQGSGYSWVDDGLQVEDAIVRSEVPATKVIEGCQATNELTVEAWITPLAADMEGPARIVTLSASSGDRNFTLGQGMFEMPSSIFAARLRTSDDSGSNNGIPQLDTPPLAAPVATHVLYVRSSAEGTDQIFVDGQPEAQGVRTGDFSGWDPRYALACGDELTRDRPWQGILHLVAVYDRALTHDEIIQNFDARF
ncbi:MAG: LamG domain-containing protein [Myxococcota bacterium]